MFFMKDLISSIVAMLMMGLSALIPSLTKCTDIVV